MVEDFITKDELDESITDYSTEDTYYLLTIETKDEKGYRLCYEDEMYEWLMDKYFHSKINLMLYLASQVKCKCIVRYEKVYLNEDYTFSAPTDYGEIVGTYGKKGFKGDINASFYDERD